MSKFDNDRCFPMYVFLCCNIFLSGSSTGKLFGNTKISILQMYSPAWPFRSLVVYDKVLVFLSVD